jgi:hypothetical protein
MQYCSKSDVSLINAMIGLRILTWCSSPDQVAVEAEAHRSLAAQIPPLRANPVVYACAVRVSAVITTVYHANRDLMLVGYIPYTAAIRALAQDRGP